jgi:hypothetical protein
LNEKWNFRQFLRHKVQEIARFWRCFCVFSWLGAYLPPLTPSTTTPCPGTPPTNRRRTAVSELPSWSLALSTVLGLEIDQWKYYICIIPENHSALRFFF